MSRITYSGRNMTIAVDGLDDVARALGSLRSKTPAVTKVAINTTARETRKLMIARAKARYAVNAAGQRHLNDLKQTKPATNTRLQTDLHISKMRSDMGYFEHSPTQAFTGGAAKARAGTFYTGHILRETAMVKLSGGHAPNVGTVSKGFLVEFHNDNGNNHIGMAQRIIGSHSGNTTTRRGARRWVNAEGSVEKLRTMPAVSATAMLNTIWPSVEPEAEVMLSENLARRVEQVLENAKRGRA